MWIWLQFYDDLHSGTTCEHWEILQMRQILCQGCGALRRVELSLLPWLAKDTNWGEKCTSKQAKICKPGLTLSCRPVHMKHGEVGVLVLGSYGMDFSDPVPVTESKPTNGGDLRRIFLSLCR